MQAVSAAKTNAANSHFRTGNSSRKRRMSCSRPYNPNVSSEYLDTSVISTERHRHKNDLSCKDQDPLISAWMRVSRFNNRAVTMSGLSWLTDVQPARLELYLLKSHGKSRVADWRVLSGIIFTNYDSAMRLQTIGCTRRSAIAGRGKIIRSSSVV